MHFFFSYLAKMGLHIIQYSTAIGVVPHWSRFIPIVNSVFLSKYSVL